MALSEVEFHTGVVDSIDFACRLLRKAHRSGVRVLVTAPPQVLDEIDPLLWALDDCEFIPHVRVTGAVPSLAARTPVWLSTNAQVNDSAVPRVLVNLGADAPSNSRTFERLIEIVGIDADDADRGRERWRAYKALGLEIKHHGAASHRD